MIDASPQIDLFEQGSPPPRASAGGFNDLRYYQEEAVARTMRILLEEDARSCLVVSATGTGKTQMFCAIANRWRHGRVLILSHRTELVDQAAKRLISMSDGDYVLGWDVAIEQGQNRSNRHSRFISGSVASVRTRLDRIEKQGGVGLIIVDEAHHATARSYRKILDRFPGAKVVGVTATPKRSDNKAMGMVFDRVAYVYGISQAVQEGFLLPIEGENVVIDTIDLDRVDERNGDLVSSQLDDEMAKNMDGMIRALVERVPYGGEQGIIFCPGVLTAHYAAERLNKGCDDCAAVIDGKTDPDERASIIARFRRGSIQWLANCLVATEGFDAPSASVVAMMRPTKSHTIYAQCVGRALRTAAGVITPKMSGKGMDAERREAIAMSSKPRALVLDFVGNSERHNLINPVDILGGDYTDEEIRLAKTRQRKEGGDPAKNLEWSRDLLRRTARSRSDVSVTSSTTTFDPLSACGVSPERDRQYNIHVRAERAITPKMIAALRNMGFRKSDLDGLTMYSGRQLFKAVERRKAKGLCSIHQLNALSRFGVTDKRITFDNARHALSYVNSCLEKRQSPDQNKLVRIAKGKDK